MTAIKAGAKDAFAKLSIGVSKNQSLEKSGTKSASQVSLAEPIFEARKGRLSYVETRH